MKIKNKQAFTLVELIVVITILAILSTIGFVSYSGYLAGTRDSNRISQLKAISEGLQLYSTNHSLPTPDTKSTSVMDGSTQIATQGYAGKNVLETITYSTEGLDPKDNIYYSYYLTKNKKYYQLMGWLEEEDNLQNQATGVDYSIRFPIVFGNKLGILTTRDNEPIQEVLTTIDISNLSTEIKSYLKDSEYVSGTGSRFSNLDEVDENGGQYWRVENNLFVYFDPNAKNYWIKETGENSWASDIISDINGNVYAVGSLWDTISNVFGQSFTNSGGGDGIVTKLDSFGYPLWSKKIGGTGYDGIDYTALDTNGNIYIAGTFSDTIDVFGETFTSSGLYDGYISKLDSSGNALWSKKMGGTGYDWIRDIKLDSFGNIYIAGAFRDTSDIFGETFTTSGLGDGFITKLDTNGNSIWSKQMGGTGYDAVRDIALNTNGNIYVAGYFSNTADIFGETFTSSGDWDGYISKLDTNGNSIWSKRFGGTGSDGESSIKLDTNGNIYISGYFSNTVDIFGETFTSSGSGDKFISKLNSFGNPIWSKQISYTENCNIEDFELDTNGNIYAIGGFKGMIDILGQVLNSTGDRDGFVTKIDSSGNPIWSKKMGGTGYDYIYNIDVDGKSNIYIVGDIEGTVDIFGEERTVSGRAAFIGKLSPDGTLY